MHAAYTAAIRKQLKRRGGSRWERSRGKFPETFQGIPVSILQSSHFVYSILTS